MIYLDYAADTPVDDEVLSVFCSIQKDFMANPNASHRLGIEAKEKLNEITTRISQCLGVKNEEIIYTSGATESNNLGIKGALNEYKRYGKHVITTILEHSSVTGPFSAMETLGFEVDYVNIQPDGTVDIEHLKELIREDTILVSTAYVDSECGIIQPVKEIANIVHQKPHCLYHVDATQAVGKIPLELEALDMVTMTAHKINGVHGIGILIKKEGIHLMPLHSGGISTTPFRSGTPSLALIASFEMALTKATIAQQEAYKQVSTLNKVLRIKLADYQKVKINSNEAASPFILNISVLGVKATTFAKALENKEIFIATKSACTSPNTPSRAVYAMTGDRKRAMSTLRISLSKETSLEEIQTFLIAFDQCYNELVK